MARQTKAWNKYKSLETLMRDGNRKDYIARAPCGCIHACCANIPGNPEIAQEIAAWIRDGYTVELVPIQVIREHFGRNCPQCQRVEQSAMDLEVKP